jgi:hypothetical protein
MEPQKPNALGAAILLALAVLTGIACGASGAIAVVLFR